MSSNNKRKIAPPFVRMKRLNLADIDPDLLHTLSVSVTQNGEICKFVQKETEIKEKRKKSESLSYSAKRTKKCITSSTMLSPSKKDGKSTGKKSCSKFKVNKIKNVELCNSTENITFSDNADLCNISSTRSLFCDVNEIFISKTKDKNILEDNFKMKPITQISSCQCDTTCVPAIIDYSAVHSAFKFFKWHKEKSNLPSGFKSSKGKLSHFNNLSFEKNESTLPNVSLHCAEDKSSQSLIESNPETVFLELDLGAISECTTTESNYSECQSIKEISKNTTSSNSDFKISSGNIISSQNFTKNKQCKTKTLSMNKEPKFKTQHKTGTLPVDEDFSNSMLDNFQNDKDLEICDIQGEYSEEIIQTIVVDSYQNDEEVNLSFVSNNEQDSLINNEKVKSNKESSESLEKGDMAPKQIDSIQPLDNFLNSKVSGANLLVLSKENNTALSIETVDEIEKIIPITDKFSLSNVENSPNDSCEFDQVSSLKTDEHSSNSRSVYETDILADVLDYEPSEASEIENSESESSNGEIEGGKSQSNSNLPVIDNTVMINDIQSDSDNKVCDSFYGKLKKDVLVRLEDEPVETTKLCNIMENSFNKDSTEFIQKNDAFVHKSTQYFTVNINDDEHNHFKLNSGDNFSFSEHTGTVENETFGYSNMEWDETNSNEVHKGRECISYLTENEKSDNYYREQVHEYKDEVYQKSSNYTEDDSESDTEPSFKRKCFNNNQGNIIEEDNSVNELSQSKGDPLLMKLEEVLLSIQKKCKNRKIDDALYIANQYIPISDPSAQKRIFTVLFYDTMDSFRDLDPPLMEEVCLDKMKSIMEIFYDLNLYDTELCSAIIIECLSMKLTFPCGQRLFDFCEMNNVPVDKAAVKSYMNCINPSEMPLTELISFLNLLSKCQVYLPKAFLKKILNLLFEDKDSSSSLITEICPLLYYVDSLEIDRDDLKNFVGLCIEKQQWTLIAYLICVWVKKSSFIAWLIETFASHLEDIGFCYEELAKKMYDLDITVSDQAKFIFVQMGVCCLMEAYSKEYYASAFKILLVFHQHKINYIDYQTPMYNAVSYTRSVPNPSKIFVFPFTVAFTALEICLHLDRPKDAYTIFQNISLNLPEEFDEALKLEIQNQQFHYLLKITMALHLKDPFVSGIKALHSLRSITQTDFGLKNLNDYSKDIQTAYNKYMVSILNAQKKDLIKELYSYTFGPPKELFTLDSEVLRGLTIFFMKHSMLEEANNLFLLGHFMNIYNFEKPALMTPPWEMTVNSSWMSEEIKLTFLKFIKNLTPNLKSKRKTDNFDKWFSVKISIKNVPKVDYNLNCLKENSTILDRICSALKDLDSTIQWKLGNDGHSIDLIPETFYKFWFSKYSDSSKPSEIFKVTRIMRISFGESCSLDSSDSESTKQFSDAGLSKDVNYVATETYNSDNTRLDENDCVNDSSDVSAENDLLIPENNYKNNPKSYVQDNISKTSAYLSPLKTILTCSTTQADISPNNFNNSEMCDHSSRAGTYVSPRKIISYNLSTSPKIKNLIHCRKPTPKTISPLSSPEKSLLKTSNQIVSPVIQKMFSPKNTINVSNNIVSNATSENVDQNYSLRKDLNIDFGKITAKEDTLIVTVPETNSKNSVHSSSSEINLNKNVKTAKPKTVLKTLKKTILTKKKNSGKCLKYKKYNSTLLKSKSNILKLPPMKITLQNASAQNKTLRIVKPLSGIKVIANSGESKVMDSQESSFQYNIPKDVFLKIINFLKSKVMVKRKDLTPDQQQEKALSLGHSFIQRNVVTTLDKKTMKLLNDYSDNCL